jgi:hypothetical protein
MSLAKEHVEMDEDEQQEAPRDPRLSRKELAKKMRRAAYERAKQFRATDPKQVAFKEAMKQRRRDANQAAKEQRKAAKRAEKAVERAEKLAPRDEKWAALRAEKATAREQLIALRAQTATAREQLVALRMLAAVALEPLEREQTRAAATPERSSDSDEHATERSAQERRRLIKIVV